jgi:predicted GIY-YIG superfamily endonuclease
MAKTPRDTYRYELKQGSKVVYRGITNNPERRCNEHNNDKNFSHMNIVGPRVTRSSARRWEQDSLQTYRKTHKGKNPKYNKKKSG